METNITKWLINSRLARSDIDVVIRIVDIRLRDIVECKKFR